VNAGPMEQFSPAWLALREPYDRACRSKALARAFLDALPHNARIVDLACGSGANADYLTALGRHDVRWRLFDADRTLLSLARERVYRSDALCVDLARPRRMLDFGHCDGITASALCDLVSGNWLEGLIRDAARHALPLLLALSVDGRVAFSPSAPADQVILNCFRRDQRHTKGFGPALGPAAPLRLARVLRAHGYRIRCAASDWRLGAGDHTILRALVTGFADVALKHKASARTEIEAWRRQREAQISRRRFSLVIGHVDLLAFRRLKQGSQAVTLP
jgi:SAM-dependent methyltransferase